jgi:hypothetical protein
MKLAGEFEHLGYAFKGDPEFDAPPPKGVVKLYYPGGLDGEGSQSSSRVGFFKCPWGRWGAFKEAATRMQPDRKAWGIYPTATIGPVSHRPHAAPADKHAASGR